MDKGSGHIQHHCLGLIARGTASKNIPLFTVVSLIVTLIRKHLS